MKYIKLTPEGVASEVEVSEDYLDIQKHVGGYFECPRVYGTLPENASVFVNESGLLIGLPHNRAASILTGHYIVGNMLIGGPVDDEGEITPYTPEIKSAIENVVGRF